MAGEVVGQGRLLGRDAPARRAVGRIAEIVDAEAERSLGAGTRHRQRRAGEADGCDRGQGKRGAQARGSSSTSAGNAASAASGATAQSGPSTSSISIKARSSANIRNWRIAAARTSNGCEHRRTPVDGYTDVASAGASRKRMVAPGKARLAAPPTSRINSQAAARIRSRSIPDPNRARRTAMASRSKA